MTNAVEQSGIAILLIGCDARTTRRLQRMLTAALGDDVTLTHARTLASALGYLAGAHPAVALFDVSRLHDKGVDAVVRLHVMHPGVPVVVLTAADDAMRRQVLRAGAHHCLAKKDISARWLGHAIRDAIERQRLAEEASRSASVRIEQARLDGALLVARTMVDAMNNDLAVVFAMAEIAMQQISEEQNVDPEALEYVLTGTKRAAEHIRQLEAIRRIVERAFPGLPPMLDLERSAG